MNILDCIVLYCIGLDWIGMNWIIGFKSRWTFFTFPEHSVIKTISFFKLIFLKKWICHPANFALVDTDESIKSYQIRTVCLTYFFVLSLYWRYHYTGFSITEIGLGVFCLFFIFILLFNITLITCKLSSVTVVINTTSWILTELAGKD